jgi:hypothetical protein
MAEVHSDGTRRAQSHFLELCQVLGQPSPSSDATAENYAFEKSVGKVGGKGSGGMGFADVWLRDHFAWEYKGKRKNLDEAYDQILQYREQLGNPPLLVVCDLNRRSGQKLWSPSTELAGMRSCTAPDLTVSNSSAFLLVCRRHWLVAGRLLHQTYRENSHPLG